FGRLTPGLSREHDEQDTRRHDYREPDPPHWTPRFGMAGGSLADDGGSQGRADHAGHGHGRPGSVLDRARITFPSQFCAWLKIRAPLLRRRTTSTVYSAAPGRGGVIKIPTHDAGSMKVASRSLKMTPLAWSCSWIVKCSSATKTAARQIAG